MSTRRLEEFLNLPETQTLISVDDTKEVDTIRLDVTPQPEPDVVETSVSFWRNKIILICFVTLNTFYENCLVVIKF